jgi:hypothetical protein
MNTNKVDDTHIKLLIHELKCPICKEFLSEPYVTTCGHTFCHACISRHLETRQRCPCCSAFVTSNHVHPVFAMEKVGTFPLPYMINDCVSGCKPSAPQAVDRVGAPTISPEGVVNRLLET